jgi:Uma2 family endonuclease
MTVRISVLRRYQRVQQMTKTSTVPRPPPGRWLRLSGVNWRTYTRLLRAFAERPGIRLTYDRGELEIMAPMFAHDGDDWVLDHLVTALAEELGLSLCGGRSTTLRRRLRQRGIEADECYWIANAHRIQGIRRLDLRRDPPPDLAIEVDVTHSSLDRLAIYAVLGVPEVWRLADDVLTFHVLDADGHFTEAAASRSFPMLAPADLLGFLLRARAVGDRLPIVRDFRAWVRQRAAQQQ